MIHCIFLALDLHRSEGPSGSPSPPRFHCQFGVSRTFALPLFVYPSPSRSSSSASIPHSLSFLILSNSRSACPLLNPISVLAMYVSRAFVAFLFPNSLSSGASSAAVGYCTRALIRSPRSVRLWLLHCRHSNIRWFTVSLGAWHPWHVPFSCTFIFCR